MRFASNFNVKITWRVALLAACLAPAACGGSKGPGPTPVAPPQITCPQDVTVREVRGLSQDVSYPAPATSDGSPPVTVICAPASGTSFTLGATSVMCTARDAQAREATCAFRVTVNGFALGARKFVAMGDSLTEGENGRIGVVDAPNSYPTRLQVLLQTSYPDQGITVVNRGVGRTTAEDMRDAVRGVVQAERPDALLLMSGYNDLLVACSVGNATSVACGDATRDVEFAIRDSIQKAKESPNPPKFIFVSTLVPPGPSGARRIERSAILETNGKVRQRVSAEGATLVDSYPLFIGHEAEYVSPDGLHLNPAGYQALADAFFAVIRATIPQTPQLR